MLVSIKRKHKLYKQFLCNPSETNKINYSKYRNKLTHCLRIAKRKHFADKLEEARCDTKKTWNIINEVLNRKNSKVMPSELVSSTDVQHHI